MLGAHRSGTSAVTGVLHRLGLALCRPADLMAASSANPLGYFESRPLARRNEQLLHALHAAWDCPPPAEPPATAVLRDLVRPSAARSAFVRSFPSAPWVWKDPRLCLLLPFWREVLPGLRAAVLVTRRPRAIAESLAARDGLAPAHGLVMWERYLRHALRATAGLPLAVVPYDELVSDPRRVATELREWLRDSGFRPGRVTAEVVRSVHPELAHHSAHGGPRLSTEQRRLWRQVTGLTGRHETFRPPRLSPETPGIDAFLAPRREFWGDSPVPRSSPAPLGRVAAYDDADLPSAG